MGQDISRAVTAVTGPRGRARAYDQMAQKLNLEHLGLRNDVLRQQLRASIAAGTPPGLDVPTKIKKSEFTPIAKFGGPWRGHPSFHDTQKFEDMYGDAASWPYGMLKLPMDAQHNMEKATRHMKSMKRLQKSWKRSMDKLRR